MFKICIGRNKGFERFLLTTPAAIVERRRTEPPERPVTASQNEDVIAATAPPENNNPQVAVDGIPIIPELHQHKSLDVVSQNRFALFHSVFVEGNEHPHLRFSSFKYSQR